MNDGIKIGSEKYAAEQTDAKNTESNIYLITGLVLLEALIGTAFVMMKMTKSKKF